MAATAVLSEFASTTRLSDISAAAVAATKRHILDCAGVALAAAVEPAGRIVLDVTREQGGAPQARVLGSSLRTSTVSAAWANGALAHLLDFDDTGFSHPTACILPAALAMAEAEGVDRRRSGGRRLCRAGGVRAAVVIRPAARAGTAPARLSPHLALRVLGGGGGGGQHRPTEPRPDGRRHRACGSQRRRADPALRHLGQGHSRGQRGARRRNRRPAGAAGLPRRPRRHRGRLRLLLGVPRYRQLRSRQAGGRLGNPLVDCRSRPDGQTLSVLRRQSARARRGTGAAARARHPVRRRGQAGGRRTSGPAAHRALSQAHPRLPRQVLHRLRAGGDAAGRPGGPRLVHRRVPATRRGCGRRWRRCGSTRTRNGRATRRRAAGLRSASR